MTGWTVSGSNPGKDKRFFSLLQNVQTGSWAHPASYSLDKGIISQENSGRGVNLTTPIHLSPKLRMSEAVTVLYMASWR
jgi:hypothetical protein